MTDRIDVLDHGFVRLVDHMGSDLSTVRSARVSYDAEWRAGENSGSDTRLINYLWRNKHTSPFESVSFTFEVRAPIFVFRQWHRHRTWSYNEVSGRYTMLPDQFYIPDPDMIGKQSKDNKQARDLITDTPRWRRKLITMAMHGVCMSAFAVYKLLIKLGVPRELARTILPVSTYSHMFATVNLLNLLKFIQLRNHPHAQYEIRVYAEAMLELIRPLVPTCVEAFEDKQGV